MGRLPPVPDTVPEFIEWLRSVKHTPGWRKTALVKLRWQQKRLRAGEPAKAKHKLGLLARMNEAQITDLVGKLEQEVYQARKAYMRQYMQTYRTG